MSSASVSKPDAAAAAISANNGDLFAAFGLTEHMDAFIKLLYETESFIAGGSALYYWMNLTDSSSEAHRKTPIPENMDLDIWCWTPVPPGTDFMECDDRKYTGVNLKEILIICFEHVLGKAGYVRQSDNERMEEIRQRYISAKGRCAKEIAYENSLAGSHIRCIYNFIHPDLNRKIQIMMTYNFESPEDIVSAFDFDICKFTLVAEKDACNLVKLKLKTPHVSKSDKEAICIRKIMHIDNLTSMVSDNYIARLEKYYARGFTLELPGKLCKSCCHTPDPKQLTLDEARAYVLMKVDENCKNRVGGAGAGAGAGACVV